MKRAPIVVAVAALFLGVMAGSAAASRPVTLTFHEKNATETFQDVIPCLADEPIPATITVTENGVFHVTAAGIAGDQFIPPYHVTGTFTGTFEAVPEDSSFPTFTGHFTQWFGENFNTKNHVGTFTFTVIGRGSDGSRLRFHETAHFLVTPHGVVLEFDKPRCF